jgi:hypothetical protein
MEHTHQATILISHVQAGAGVGPEEGGEQGHKPEHKNRRHKKRKQKDKTKISLFEKLGLFKGIKDSEEEVLVEYVEVNLDACGKHSLVLALLVP